MKNFGLALCLALFLSLESLLPAAQNPADEIQKLQSEQSENFLSVSQPMSLGGYAQLRYQSSKDKIDGFDIRRARLTLKGKINPEVEYRLQAELAGSQSKLLDAEMSVRLHPALKVSAGQFTIPFSYENVLSTPKILTINRSQVVEALVARGKDVIGNQNGQDIGLQASGCFNLMDYALGIFNGSGINKADLNETKDVIGRIVFHPLKTVTLGGSYYKGRYTLADTPDRSDDRERLGTEITFQTRLLSLTGEYIKGKDGRVEKSGWYMQCTCFLIPERVQGICKIDSYDADTDLTDDKSLIVTAALSYYVNRSSKINVDYEIRDEEGAEKQNNAILAQLQVVF